MTILLETFIIIIIIIIIMLSTCTECFPVGSNLLPNIFLFTLTTLSVNQVDARSCCSLARRTEVSVRT